MSTKRKLAGNEDKAINKKFSQIEEYLLDSDEEDEVENKDNILNDSDIEGEEEGISRNIEQERFTAFNIQEELEEGHFDKNGHFIWNNEKEVRDNWLDNIDWQGIKIIKSNNSEDGSESHDSIYEPSQEIELYKQIIAYMKPEETISKSLSRLGKKYKNLSSIERLKRKKEGLLDSNKEIIELTELADRVLTKSGNMDIYQETYETILNRIENFEKNTEEAKLDMYADDFTMEETRKLTEVAEISYKEMN